MFKLIRNLYSYVFGKSAGGEAIRYLIVGGLTTLVSFGLFTLLVLTAPFEVSAAARFPGFELAVTQTDIFNLISIAAAILFAYVMNKHIVFRQRSSSKAALLKEFLKFTGSRAAAMVLELVTVWLFYSVLLWNAVLGKIIATVLVIITNYILSKFLVFKPPTQPPAQDEGSPADGGGPDMKG